MTRDLFAIEDGNTEPTPEEKLARIPSLSTRAELNAFERANIHAARVWAMRPRKHSGQYPDEPAIDTVVCVYHLC
ncbi:MAG: hypothetical protein JNN01_27190 [Opitutaceae bacterium]|nr:hypothetical protein [Opitutaceae bacterium]